MLNKLLFSVIFIFLFLSSACSILTVQARNSFKLDAKLLDNAEQKFGKAARGQLLAWQHLIQDNESSIHMEILEKVNTFFNRLTFIDDFTHWHQEDYWATPVEFLASNGGDCEDFSLAKYFTLIKMGIPEEKLNLTYVKSLQLKQAHMVVTYYPNPSADPLVLDNLIPQIKPASERTDLLPVYSFNGIGLWLAKARGRGQMLRDSKGLQRWNDLLDRMPEGLY